VTAAVALYAFFLAVSPFEHHDLICHLKTPQHCTACAASAVGSDPRPAVSTAVVHLVDAGSAVADAPVFSVTLLPAASAGRSPPVVC
jgi:hypothetical protein